MTQLNCLKPLMESISANAADAPNDWGWTRALTARVIAKPCARDELFLLFHFVKIMSQNHSVVHPKTLLKRNIATNAGRLNALSVGSTTIADLIDSLSLDKILIWLLYPSFSSNIIWMSCFQASNDF